MLRVTLKSVRGHVLRFLLTLLAVTLGVSLVSGTFVLRDSVSGTLDSLVGNAVKGLDVQVRGREAREDAGMGGRPALPLALGSTLREVPGVARAVPDLQGVVMLVGRDGGVVRNGGAPTLGFPFRDDDPSFELVEGRAPASDAEVVVEDKTLKRSGLRLGDSTQAVVGGRPTNVTVVGRVTFGSLFGATAVLVREDVAEREFAPDGTVASFTITADEGVSQTQLRDRVAAVTPPDAEVLTGERLEAETKDSINNGLNFFTLFLVIFAGISVFVGAFIIVNTFLMLVAQRTRELALLRALGASRGQVGRLVLGEALVVGLVGGLLGLFTGVGLAVTLQALAREFLGADISGAPVRPWTVVISLLVGGLVTLIAAVYPAWRAGRISPMAALRDDMVSTPKSLVVRGLIGGVMCLLGAAAVVAGVLNDSPVWGLVGLGAFLLAVGVLIAAPLAVRPVVVVLSAPFVQLTRVVGRIARGNALRVSRRTALTGAALMIGLTLISGLAVVSASTKASVADLVERQVTADWVVQGGGTASVPEQAVDAIAAVPGVAASTPVTQLEAVVPDAEAPSRKGTKDVGVSVADGADLGDMVVLDMRSGTVDGLDPTHVLVSEEEATAQGWKIGSVVPVSLGTLTDVPLTVAGVYEAGGAIDTPLIVDYALYEKAVPAPARFTFAVYVRAAEGVDPESLRAPLDAIAKPYLVLSVQNGEEYVDSVADQVDQLLNILYVLLALSIVIAVLGIVNTLALSVFERTREIGLLRAVGLRRRQLAGMITIEAVVTSIFGAVLGLGLGLGLGIALRHGLSDQGLTVLAIPWGTIIAVLLLAAFVGVVAAVLPAIRAVRLNVLKAIATD